MLDRLKHHPMHKVLTILVLTTVLASCKQECDGFKVIAEEIDGIVIEARYATPNNFVGDVVEGYHSDRLRLSAPAIAALSNVQDELEADDLGLKIFDAYRPQQAVDHFVRWAKDLDDTLNKHTYYPDVPKTQLFAKGYIAAKSGHTRGSTVDLTIIDLKTGAELDMGSPWDFFGQISHGNYLDLSAVQLANRKRLKDLMVKHGFVPLPEEWWHFTLAAEPYPDTYFDCPVD